MGDLVAPWAVGYSFSDRSASADYPGPYLHRPLGSGMKTLLTAAAIATLSLSPNSPALADVQENSQVADPAPPQREPRVTREARLREALRQANPSPRKPRWAREARLRETCRLSGYSKTDI